MGTNRYGKGPLGGELGPGPVWFPGMGVGAGGRGRERSLANPNNGGGCWLQGLKSSSPGGQWGGRLARPRGGRSSPPALDVGEPVRSAALQAAEDRTAAIAPGPLAALREDRERGKQREPRETWRRAWGSPCTRGSLSSVKLRGPGFLQSTRTQLCARDKSARQHFYDISSTGVE